MALVVGFVGFSDSGKTTLISRITKTLLQKDYKIAVIKHDAHGHYKEVAGTDSSCFIEAGAQEVITLSPNSIFRFQRKEAVQLGEILLTLQQMDIVLVEGFKTETHPQIALFRDEQQASILSVLSTEPIAIATDFPYKHASIPTFNLNDEGSIAEFIESLWRKNIKV